ncbi:cytochrome b5-like [Anthonomus grandis grandis]|uniref:cytochrome b5-like n=1 Tax=Anthonomus grandis grandis TaxID=2921223 RepID=UPI002165A3B0|nr:cytochrome b5-like [Anthonomus grandis grandis]
MSQEEEKVTYFTLEEVKKHDGATDDRVWIIYKDIVYDVSSYLEEHPGGSELITEYAGKDATKAFDDFGHSSDAKKMLKAYKIGEVVEEERKGKIKKKEKPSVVNVNPAKPQTRSCFSIITCGLCG